MGGDGIPKVPDWRTCTVGPHTPELQKVERMLSSLNLKDPWLRNEAWRFDRRPGGAGFDRKPTMKKFLSRGMLPGFGLACITAGVHYYLESQNSHGHH